MERGRERNRARWNWRRPGRDPERLGRPGRETWRPGTTAARFPGRARSTARENNSAASTDSPSRWDWETTGRASSRLATFAATPKSGHTEVQEVREPVVDVFEEEDHVLVVAEIARHRRGRRQG